MNLLLVEAGEVAGDLVTVEGRRATHLRDVLGVIVGSSVRAGVVGGGVGSAEVVSDTDGRITLRIAVGDGAPAPLPVEIILAVPRPKVLTRTIEAIASFGALRITLTNAWRVDKSYLSSPRLAPDALAHAARLGAEQGVTTHVPKLLVYRRLMELLDTRFAKPGGDLRLIAHPTGIPLENAVRSDAPLTLAVGPEGGWIERELETFVARGFVAVSLGTQILRVETAVASALGQLVLLRRLSER